MKPIKANPWSLFNRKLRSFQPIPKPKNIVVDPLYTAKITQSKYIVNLKQPAEYKGIKGF